MNSEQLTPARLLKLVLASTCFAVIAFVAVILPAEYAIDPLGTGDYLGLVGLGSAPEKYFSGANCAHKQARIRFELAPFESVEYSYAMQREAVLLFSWQASGKLYYNLHGSVAGTATRATSSAAGEASAQQGHYMAPFNGQHGWFWENRTNATQTLELVVAGFVGSAEEAADNFFERKPLTPVLAAPRSNGCEN